MRSLAELRRRLAAYVPQVHDGEGRERAAVALVLREDEQTGDLALLLIQRAQSEGDRWSGHIAFPGGRVAAGDAGAREAAERETREEVGLDLRPEHYAGRLDDLFGRSDPIVVSGFVYALPSVPVLTANHEVERAFWLPLSELLDERRHVERDFCYREHSLALPAIQVLDEEAAPVLWGLSYRFVEILMELLGGRIPGMPWHSQL